MFLKRMTKITKDTKREIIDDFAKEIKDRKRDLVKPEKFVINFRKERVNNDARDVYEVPTEILRFRKDNGRITSDVLSYEKNYRPLSEVEMEDQKILGEFLLKKDDQKTEELKNSLLHEGQREPAIITCDGFLVNGNRRKLAFEILQDGFAGDPRFQTMKVVILPGKNDSGGRTTNKEIEQIENRYQLQSDGKAEYYNFDRALSIRRKIQEGLSLEEQLRDDPSFASLDKRKFKNEIKRVENELLGPLKCVDRYLEYLGRDGLYDTVSGGRGDREGRWQAFIDYHKSVHQKLQNKNTLMKMGVEEDEVGKIENVAFKIIRKRKIPTQGKVHMIMRAIPKLLKHQESKNELLKISEIDDMLSREERADKDGKEFDPKTIDFLWGGKYKARITQHIRLAKDLSEYDQIAQTPLTLLYDALKKLNHEEMKLESIQPSDHIKTRKLITSIREEIKSIEHKFYQVTKMTKKQSRRTS